MIDFVIPVRDREPERVKLCIQSLSQYANRIFVVDYGSTKYFCNSSIFTDHRGTILFIPQNKCPIWNKSHALNIGIRETETLYVATIDCDTILHPDFVTTAMSHLSYNKFIYTIDVRRVKIDYSNWNYTQWNYETYNRLHSISYEWSNNPKYIGNVGGIQIFPRAWIDWVGGYDETLCYWGGVDTDLFLKAKLFMETVAIQHTILHQEHDKSKEEHIEGETEREYAKQLRLKRPREVREKIASGNIRQEVWGKV